MSLRDDSLPLAASGCDNLADSLVALTEDVFEVRSIRRRLASAEFGLASSNKGTVLELMGKMRVPSDRAYRLISERFRVNGYLALFRRSADGEIVIALPGELPKARSRVWLALLLFLATLASVLMAGSTAGPETDFLTGLLSGWPFAASLLGILAAHEFGHYLVSRKLGVPSSLPYFIPLPLSFLGTLGAVIQMKAPPYNRRALLAIAAAGPLAGLAVALPVLVLGLKLSTVESLPTTGPYFQEGNSLIYAAIKLLVFGRFLPAGGQDVFLHPVAMAGWTGLLVTGLNLIPAGQLDGGHIAYALLGERARWLTWGVVAALVGLSLLWNGWAVWVALVLVFGRVHAVPLDDITPLRTFERALVFALAVVFALVFTPMPMAF